MKTALKQAKRNKANLYKRILAVGQSSMRICPTCGQYTWVTVTMAGDGMERWQCSANDCIKTYTIVGGLS